MERSHQSPACGSPKLWILRVLRPSTFYLSKWNAGRAAGEERCIRVGGRAPIGLCPGRVVVTLNPQSSGTQWETASEKGRDLELSTESPCELQQPEPSPFSSKRTMYETEEVRPPTFPRWAPFMGLSCGKGPTAERSIFSSG